MPPSLGNKESSLALHFRHAPERERALRALVTDAAPRHGGYQILHGKMVVEIKPAHANKGTAPERQKETPDGSWCWRRRNGLDVRSARALHYPNAVTSTGFLHPQMLDLDTTPVFVQVLGDQSAVAVVRLVLAAQQAAFVQHFP